EGGNVTAEDGSVELGSVAGNSLVSLSPTNQGWAFGYEGVQNFQNIELIKSNQISSTIDTHGEGNSNVQMQGKLVRIAGSYVILVYPLEEQSGGNLTVNASDSVVVEQNAQLFTQS
ncbi:MAG: filamentous hemagglutinin N-terminal domain-containing protein, partial [Nostoc sp.]